MQKSLKAIFLLVFFQGITLGASAQEGIRVYQTTDSKGNCKFYCTNENYCDYTEEVYFSELVNYNWQVQLPYQGVVNHGRNFLFSLEAGDPDRQSSLLYSTTFYKGCINPGIDQSFSYLLPISAGQTTEPINLEYLKINENDRAPKDYYALVLR